MKRVSLFLLLVYCTRLLQGDAPATVALPKSGADALIGHAAPPIRVAEWVSGSPLDHFETGKIYVVDFWATWCGPCQAAIPHLTRLAKEHAGKVEIVGISISETQDGPQDLEYIKRVRKFVAKMGDRMGYRVGVDTPDKQMHRAWFKPADTAGIPTAYIIDRKGLVAWVGIGTPEDIERILKEVMAGTFDYSKEAELQRQAEVEAQHRSAVDIAAARERAKGTDIRYPGYRTAMERGDTSAALASLNAAFAADPSSETAGAYQWKLMLLLQRNKPVEVNAYARQLLDRYAENDDVMSFLSACIVATSEEEPRFDARLALESARKTAEKAKPNSRWAQFAQWRLGWAYYHLGESDKALICEQLAWHGVRSLKATIDFGNLETECEDAIRLMKGERK